MYRGIFFLFFLGVEWMDSWVGFIVWVFFSLDDLFIVG